MVVLSIMRFALFVSIVVATAASQAGEIRLKEHAEAAGPLVRLGDVVEIAAET